jgi:hypothetical protein
VSDRLVEERDGEGSSPVQDSPPRSRRPATAPDTHRRAGDTIPRGPLLADGDLRHASNAISLHYHRGDSPACCATFVVQGYHLALLRRKPRS